MKTEDKMQGVTFVCDCCGVKLPVVPPGTGVMVKDQEEFAHFVLVVKSAAVAATHIKLGEGPSHGRQQVGGEKQIDVCNGCAKKPFTQIVVEACQRLGSP